MKPALYQSQSCFNENTMYNHPSTNNNIVFNGNNTSPGHLKPAALELVPALHPSMSSSAFAGISSSTTISSGSIIDYKEKYRALKNKFKFLVFENECYQEELRNLQRKLLKLSRDKNFLLDRLLHYERAEDSSEDSDATLPSDDEAAAASNPQKRKASRPEPTPEQKAKRRRADAARRKRQKELQMQKATSFKNEHTGNLGSGNASDSSTSYQATPSASVSSVSQSGAKMRITSPAKDVNFSNPNSQGVQSSLAGVGVSSSCLGQINSPTSSFPGFGTTVAVPLAQCLPSVGGVAGNKRVLTSPVSGNYYANYMHHSSKPHSNTFPMEQQQFQIEQTLVSSSATVPMGNPPGAAPSFSNHYSPKAPPCNPSAGGNNNFAPNPGPMVSNFPLPSISPQISSRSSSSTVGIGDLQSPTAPMLTSGLSSPINSSPMATGGVGRAISSTARFVTPTASPRVITPGSGAVVGGSASATLASSTSVALMPVSLPDTALQHQQ